jgi:DivIVA domain-containing protein
VDARPDRRAEGVASEEADENMIARRPGGGRIAAMARGEHDGSAREDPRESEPTPVSRAPSQAPSDVRDVSFHTAVRGYERREVDRYVQRVNRVIAELEIARSPESAVRHALDRIGEQTSSILHRARETADELIHTARSEAEERTERGRAEGRDIVAAAGAEAEEILAEADTQANERMAQGDRELAARRKQAEEARAEADATVARAQIGVNEIVTKAKEEAEQIVIRADAQAIERRAREEQRLEELRRQAQQELDTLRADRDAIVGDRRRLVEEIHELAARLDAIADASAAGAPLEPAGVEGVGVAADGVAGTVPASELEPIAEPASEPDPEG